MLGLNVLPRDFGPGESVLRGKGVTCARLQLDGVEFIVILLQNQTCHLSHFTHEPEQLRAFDVFCWMTGIRDGCMVDSVDALEELFDKGRLDHPVGDITLELAA